MKEHWLDKHERERDELHDEISNRKRAMIDPLKTLKTDAIIKIIRANLSPAFHLYIDELTYRIE
jgi:hypothetical protein